MDYTEISSPVGDILLVWNNKGLTRIAFVENHDQKGVDSSWNRCDEAAYDAGAQFAAYFCGNARVFDLPLAPIGTAFQRAVWHELSHIPYGETVSYGEIALRLGRPSASRAVGSANGSNPLPVVVPCHRVVGADGSIAGYSGGTEIKRFLLGLECRHAYQLTAT